MYDGDYRTDLMRDYTDDLNKSFDIEKAFNKLKPIHKYIFYQYYFAGYTMLEIANKLDLNESRISQIISEIDKKFIAFKK